MPDLKPARVALIHDWLTGMRGGEKVLEVLCEIFPQADVFTLVHLPGKVSPLIERHAIRTSPLQRVPGIEHRYRHLLPLMPWAISRFDFSGYDRLISSSHCVAKGVRPPPGVPHDCYCHTPMRYVWDLFDDYFGPGRAPLHLRAAMRTIRPFLQRWDVRTSDRVTRFFANSRHVQERIRRLYGRDSQVLYPPVDYAFFSQPAAPPPAPLPYYLMVSAFAPYKRIDLAIDAFNRLGKPLIIIGDGQEAASLKKLSGPTIRFIGWQDPGSLRSYYAHCRALIFPGEEDFGIVPLEAMSAGSPVIAYRKGGALETVVEGLTGAFFDQQNARALDEAVRRFEDRHYEPERIRQHAERFSRSRCLASFQALFLDYPRANVIKSGR